MDLEAFESPLLEIFYLFGRRLEIRMHGRKGHDPAIPDALEPLMDRLDHLGFCGNAADHGKVYACLVHGLNESLLSAVAKARDAGPALNRRQGP